MVEEKLRKLEQELESVEDALNEAKGALAEDTQVRSRSFWARFVGAITTTPAKRALILAEAEYLSTSDRIHQDVSAWVKESARRKLGDDLDVAALSARYKEDLAAREKCRDQTNVWFDAGDRALVALREAERKCRSAAMVDTIDAFSSQSKVMDALAYMETSSARSAANNARDAVSRLVQLLPADFESVVLDAPDGLFGFVVGALDMPTFDFFIELSNAAKLSSVADKCKDAVDRLSPLHGRLKAMLTRSEQAVEEVTSKLADLERGFLEEAYQRVPESIRGTLPTSID
ncbi:hypothetical protein [Paraburkholderia sp. SIMBA_054]|uniref:hypothetical protein n=1 Tax=Paraburkholderia sp. SIMBA_054 TaxID=3085795 RepID=UPI00397ADED9